MRYGLIIFALILVSGCGSVRLDEKKYVDAVMSVSLRSSDSSMFRTRAQDSLLNNFPVYYDWWLQDGGAQDLFTLPLRKSLASRIKKVSEQLGVPMPDLSTKGDKELFSTYHKLCEKRRAKRLENMPDRIVFTKFRPFRPPVFAATESVSDSRGDRNFVGGGQMSILKMRGIWGHEQLLLQSDSGMVRDPDIDFDARKLLFAWKKGAGDDYHLYEMDLYTQAIKQISKGTGYADYEGRYLPDGGILFASTRAATSLGDIPTEVSNFFVCDRNGNYMRRIGFDQGHTISPSVLEDGRVMYTRSDHNDRGNIFASPLFVMNGDGTSQQAFFSMTDRFPTTLTHARQIPSTNRILTILTGYHSPQHGKLAIINPEGGRGGENGLMMVAPLREPNDTEKLPVDIYGQYGEQFQYPFPIDRESFLISYSPLGYNTGEPKFAIYWMNMEGERELLVSDRRYSCNQPVIIRSRTKPRLRASHIDYSKETGQYMIQNIYAGNSMVGVKRGTVKKLRIVELMFRNAGIGKQTVSGPGGSSQVTTPVGVAGTSWDVKRILGHVDVMPDGSAYFEAPARTPLYFQALDTLGHVIATMRSWSTLQPGESRGCVGCHESHNTTPLTASAIPQIAYRPIDSITPVPHLMPEKGFSYIENIQPILDRNCVRCHNGAGNTPNLLGTLTTKGEASKRRVSESYITLTHAQLRNKNKETLTGNEYHPDVNWIGSMTDPMPLKPYTAGSASSKLIRRLREGHGKLDKRQIETIAAWIDLGAPFAGSYTEANNWNTNEIRTWDYYSHKRHVAEDEDKRNVEAYINSLR